MSEVRFGAGEIVFREGDPSDAVLLIATGDVEVVKAMGAGSVLLGKIGAGEFVGEMGVIEGRARSATVRALGPVTGELLDRDAFLGRVSQERELAFNVLLRLSERLHAADERLAGTPAPTTVGQRVRLFADSAALADQIPTAGIAIERFPFLVGRRPEAGEPRPGSAVQLELGDAAPYRLSRQHFAIVKTGEDLAVSDSHSTLGTVVNDEPIGGLFSRSRVDLRPGENRVVAGGAGSPFAFRLVVG